VLGVLGRIVNGISSQMLGAMRPALSRYAQRCSWQCSFPILPIPAFLF
jgi:hypothetical protein